MDLLFAINRFISNGIRVFRSPRLLWAYIRWLRARLQGNEGPVVRFRDGTRISGFATFSEYWARRCGLDHVDIDALQIVFERSPRDEPKLAIDVGANLGLFSLAMARAGFDRVVAFEPVPDTYNRFVANLNRNPELAQRVVPRRLALAARSGPVAFEIHAASPGQNKIARGRADLPVGVPTMICNASTIDAQLAELNGATVSLLKIDVEGFECSVLKGAAHSLRDGRIRFIYCEVIPHALSDAGSSLAELGGLLSSYGFEPVTFLSRCTGRLHRTTLQQALKWAGARRNVLFEHLAH